MKKLLLYVFISVLLSCNQQRTQDVSVQMDIEKISEFNVVKIEIFNNTGRNIYINKIKGSYLYKNLNIINQKYQKSDSSFIFDEEFYNKNNFPGVTDILGSLNKSTDFYTELEDLEKMPFTFSKDLIKNAIDIEYKKLIKVNNPCLLTTNDISLIKSLILYKYQGVIILKPKESYKQYISINSLLKDNYPSKLVFDYNYSNKFEEIIIDLEYPGDSIKINTIPLETIGDYGLYKKSFSSDTLYLN